MLKLIDPEFRVIIVFLGILFAGSYALSADGEKVTGKLFFPPVTLLSDSAMAEIALVDVSRVDAPAKTITALQIPVNGEEEATFRLHFDPKDIDPARSYVVQARVMDGGRLAFISDTSHPVLTNGFSDKTEIKLVKVSSFKMAATKSIYGANWLVEDIDGGGVIDMARSTMILTPSGAVSGSGGCNGFQGSAVISNQEVKFGPMAMTRKMCPPALMDQEAKYMKALSAARTFKIEGAFLRFYDRSGKPVLRLTHL
jgi:putative lipoprotein